MHVTYVAKIEKPKEDQILKKTEKSYDCPYLHQLHTE